MSEKKDPNEAVPVSTKEFVSVVNPSSVVVAESAKEKSTAKKKAAKG